MKKALIAVLLGLAAVGSGCSFIERAIPFKRAPRVPMLSTFSETSSTMTELERPESWEWAMLDPEVSSEAPSTFMVEPSDFK